MAVHSNTSIPPLNLRMWREKNEHRWYGDLENFRKNFTQKKNDVTAKDSFFEMRESSLFSVHFQIAEMLQPSVYSCGLWLKTQFSGTKMMEKACRGHFELCVALEHHNSLRSYLREIIYSEQKKTESCGDYATHFCRAKGFDFFPVLQPLRCFSAYENLWPGMAN